MLVFLQLSPILAAFAVLLVLRRPPIEMAIVGAALVAVLWDLNLGAAFASSLASDMIRDILVLFLGTSVVIASGFAVVIMIEPMSVNTAMADWVRSPGWSPTQQGVFIALVTGLAKISAAEEQAPIRFASAVVCLNTVLAGLTGSVIIALW